MDIRGKIASRIGTGLVAMSALLVLIWPSDPHILQQWDRLIAFITAISLWIAAECTQNGEQTKPPTQNDLRVARELAELHAGELRYLLKETDLWTFVDSEIYSRLGGFLNRWERGTMHFHDEDMNRRLSVLMSTLNELHHKISQDTVPEMINGKMRTGYKPARTIPQEEYDRLLSESKVANKIASKAWNQLDVITSEIRQRFQSAFDDPIA